MRPLGDGADPAALGAGLDLAALGQRRFIWPTRENAPIAEWKVPPEKAALLRSMPRIRTGTPSGSCCTVNSAPRSCGIESKPQACTSRAPVSTARAWWATYIRSTNSGSPVRSA